MKKTIFAALCCAALFGFTACEETVTSDVYVSMSNTIGEGGTLSDVTLSEQAMNIFVEELVKVGGTQATDSQTGAKMLAVILRQQTDDAKVKQKVEQAASSADKRVKAELNLPDAINPDCTEFLIHLYYSHVKDSDKTQLTYTYKEKE